MKDYIMQLETMVHNHGFIVFILSVVDIITGYCGAKINKEFETKIMKKGLITHSLIVTSIFLAQIYAPDFHLSPMADAYTLAVIVMELNSLKENYIKLGGDPSIFKVFDKFKGGTKK